MVIGRWMDDLFRRWAAPWLVQAIKHLLTHDIVVFCQKSPHDLFSSYFGVKHIASYPNIQYISINLQPLTAISYSDILIYYLPFYFIYICHPPIYYLYLKAVGTEKLLHSYLLVMNSAMAEKTWSCSLYYRCLGDQGGSKHIAKRNPHYSVSSIVLERDIILCFDKTACTEHCWLNNLSKAAAWFWFP